MKNKKTLFAAFCGIFVAIQSFASSPTNFKLTEFERNLNLDQIQSIGIKWNASKAIHTEASTNAITVFEAFIRGKTQTEINRAKQEHLDKRYEIGHFVSALGNLVTLSEDPKCVVKFNAIGSYESFNLALAQVNVIAFDSFLSKTESSLRGQDRITTEFRIRESNSPDGSSTIGNSKIVGNGKCMNGNPAATTQISIQDFMDHFGAYIRVLDVKFKNTRN